MKKSFKVKTQYFFEQILFSHHCSKGIPFLFLLLFTYSLFGQTNEGNSFWFGFMEHRDINVNTKVAMITSKYNTSGQVSVPLQNWSQPFTVTANQVTIITLPAYTEVIGSENIEEVGARIESTLPVSFLLFLFCLSTVAQSDVYSGPKDSCVCSQYNFSDPQSCP